MCLRRWGFLCGGVELTTVFALTKKENGDEDYTGWCFNDSAEFYELRLRIV